MIVREYGQETVQTRVLPAWTTLKAGQRFRIYLTSDTSTGSQVQIQYGSNLMDGITCEVNGDQLEILDKNNFNWVRNFRHQPVCTLNVSRISRLDIEGAAEIICLDSISSDKVEVNMNSVGNQLLWLHCGQLYGACTNTGRVEFRGQGTIFAWSCEDGGSFDASAMRCDDAYIYHYTALDVSVNPKNLLEAWAYGTGNIYYKRDPLLALKKNEFGRGQILKKQ